MQSRIDKLNGQLRLLENKPRNFSTERGYYKDFGKWHEYKSRVENTFKEWIPIFFNVAIREAKQRGFEIVRIITANALMKLWGQYVIPETQILFDRVYDATAKQYSATPVSAHNREWHEINLSQTGRIAMKKNWLNKIHKFSQEHEWFTPMVPGGNKFVWQVHLDKYIEIMLQRMPELQQPEFGTGTDYEQKESLRYVFAEWLKEVPDELKLGENLHPDFKQKVRNYMIYTHDFDPYEEDDAGVPSAEDLSGWWS